MSLGVVINIVLAQVPMHLKLPFFLDVIGTIVISALAGPWIGALTGLVTNFVLGLQNPIWIPYALVQISIGLSVGFLAQKGAFKSYGGLALVAFVVWLFHNLPLFQSPLLFSEEPQDQVQVSSHCIYWR